MTTTNNNLSVRRYDKQYAGIFSTVFGVRKAFADAFVSLQITDGVLDNKNAFSVKTNATPVVVGEYSVDANKGFGTGTENSSRFGELKEIIYADTDVPYSYKLAIHEGIDRFTVNNDLNAAIADRLKLQSEAQTRKANKENGKFLSDNAGKEIALTKVDEDNVKSAFQQVERHLIDSEVMVPVTAYVRPEIKTIVDALVKKSVSSGFATDIKVVAESSANFDTNVLAIFAPDGIAIPFVGIQTARTVEAQEFDGVKLQAAAKGGTFILDDNKKAVIKLTGTPTL